jgi:2-isopropylmalate synthase
VNTLSILYGSTKSADGDATCLELMDTTFREKTFGVTFSTGEKFSIIEQLNSMGISFVELRREEDQEIIHSSLWSATNRKMKPVLFEPSDPIAVEPNIENITVRASCLEFSFAKREGARSINANCDLAEDFIALRDRITDLRRRGMNIFFDAQHFFDGFYENSDYALTLLETASKAGASRIVLSDSRGASLPEQVERATKIVLHYLSNHRVVLGIHAHNDCGLAVANTIAAVKAGARHVQATVNGIGERSGNADLCQLLPLFVLKLGYKALNSSQPKERQLQGLKALSESVSKAYGFSIPNQPFVSDLAFAHSDPSHINTVACNHERFEVIDPAWVGNTRRITPDEISMIISQISELGLYTTDREGVAKNLLEKIKSLEQMGYKFNDCLASVHLLILEAISADVVVAPFSILGWEISSAKSSDWSSSVSATIRVKIGVESNSRILSADAKGVGPIHAIDLALKKALRNEFPEINQVKLTSYSLNIVDSLNGTAALARARTEFTDKDPPLGLLYNPPTWATVAVSADVVDASVKALFDGYRYKLIFLNKRERFPLPDWRMALGRRYSEK